MDLDLSVRMTRNEAIIFTELDDTVVTTDVEEGRYYELDPVGGEDLGAAGERTERGRSCEAVVQAYKVPAESCREDPRAFLEELDRSGAVRRMGEVKETNT